MKLTISFSTLLLIVVTIGCGEQRVIRKFGLEAPSIEVRGTSAYVNGTLGETFYHLFEETLNENPQLTTIVLLEIPGSVNDEWNLKACLLLHKKELNTELLSTSVVESGGTDLFVSGNRLIIANGAKIGVHSWAGGDLVAAELPEDHSEHKMFLDFFNEIEVDPAFYWYTLRAAPAEGMHYMTENEINEYLGGKIMN